MARAKTNKLYRTFVKGLITEAGYLTYPEDSSTAEMNTILSRKGNRTRRLGIDYEDGAVLNDVDYSPGDAVREFVWSSANNDPTQNFLVIQSGYKIHFWPVDENPTSDGKSPFTVDLRDYNTPGSTSALLRDNAADFASGAGFLFVCHPYCDPLNIEYKESTDSIVVTSMIIQIRDLDGVDDGLPNDAEPTTLSREHHYNLLNQGWGPPGTGGTGGYYYSPYTGNTGTPTESDGVSSPSSPGGSRPYDSITNIEDLD